MMEGGEVLRRGGGWWSSRANEEQGRRISVRVKSWSHILSLQDSERRTNFRKKYFHTPQGWQRRGQLTLLEKAQQDLLSWVSRRACSEYFHTCSRAHLCLDWRRWKRDKEWRGFCPSAGRNIPPSLRINYSYECGFLCVRVERDGLWWLSCGTVRRETRAEEAENGQTGGIRGHTKRERKIV